MIAYLINMLMNKPLFTTNRKQTKRLRGKKGIKKGKIIRIKWVVKICAKNAEISKIRDNLVKKTRI